MEFALVGGEARHGGGGTAAETELPFPHRQVSQRAVYAEAASGRYRAVIAGISGRVALPAAYAGARRAKVPFVLWATLWAHPRTAAHALSYLPLRHIYRDADAIVTYGQHVSEYVRGKGARGPITEAPQAVDNDFWGARIESPTPLKPIFMFVGRLSGEKGIAVLLKAWNASGLASQAALVLVGGGPFRARAVATSVVRAVGPKPPDEVRNLYAQADVVVLPSLPTRDFLEPWGLVVNEAFNQGVPVIASDAVGAGQPPEEGLLRHERNGLVVPAGDAVALAGAMRRLHEDRALRDRLGANARADVAAYDFDAWVAGMRRGLAAVGASREKSPARSDDAPVGAPKGGC